LIDFVASTRASPPRRDRRAGADRSCVLERDAVGAVECVGWRKRGAREGDAKAGSPHPRRSAPSLPR